MTYQNDKNSNQRATEGTTLGCRSCDGFDFKRRFSSRRMHERSPNAHVTLDCRARKGARCLRCSLCRPRRSGPRRDVK